MGTVIRAEISEKNRYWISKHRHYELKHFCLQYPTWKRKYKAFNEMGIFSKNDDGIFSNNSPSDLTAAYAIKKAQYSKKIDLIEKIVIEADPDLYTYILKAVTEGLSYTYLKTKMNMPCGRDMYYDRYRRFFWLLSNSKD